jgi:glutathione S-transferase
LPSSHGLPAAPEPLNLISSPPRSASGKIPYVTLPNGEILADSSLIIARLCRDHRVDLDADLSAPERAQAHLVSCMLESHLYFAQLYERFATPEGFACVRRDYFAHLPWPLRALAPLVVRRRALANLHGQGTGRLAREEVAELARADVLTLATVLGDRPHLLGAQPRTVDATALGFLWAATSHPFESAVRTAIESHPNLLDYLARMRAAHWPDAAAGHPTVARPLDAAEPATA